MKHQTRRDLLVAGVMILLAPTVLFIGCSDDPPPGSGPIVPRPVFKSNGISGYSGMQGVTCAVCHNSPNNSDPAVAFSGPQTLRVGETATYTFALTPAQDATDANAGGLDVAVDGGTLISLTDQMTTLDSGELTHAAEKPGAMVSWQFQWQAPSTGGTYTMYGAGLSVDLDGGRSGDEVGTSTYTVTVQDVANAPPTANAGPDQTVVDTDDNGSEDVMLDGSGSSDSDGTITKWEWFEGGSMIASGEKAPANLTVGTHVVTLVVTDDADATASDETTVTVQSPTNAPPTANAGPDQTVVDTDDNGSEDVMLDGSGSSDSDGTITKWEWFEGGSMIASGEKAPANLTVGTHVITLVVTDDADATDSDDVTIVINPPFVLVVDYELRSLHVTPPEVGDPLSAKIKFKDTGVEDGLVRLELYANGTFVCAEMASEQTGKWKHKVLLIPPECQFDFSTPGEYTIEIRLIDAIGTETLSATVRVR